MNSDIHANFKRRSEYMHDIQFINNIPLFNWLEINLSELCNRTCIFCPRVSEDIYPNQNIHMSINLLDNLADQLNRLNYKGTINLSGYSEPLLYKYILMGIDKLKSFRVELVTNGDKVTSKLINELFSAGLNHLLISMYDGPSQVDYFNKLIKESNIDPSKVTLRSRWLTEKDDYGLLLTNRAGSIKTNKVADISKPCNYTAYSMMLDWNGDILLCTNDWSKKIRFGNISNQNIYDIWKSSYISKVRTKLINGDRNMSPCNVCTADGTLLGGDYVDVWNKL
jgi:radical SAM protein with 4Fe4S-binding SPASM domain